MDFLILAALIVLNGCFAMAEIALVTARRNRLQKLADAGAPDAIETLPGRGYRWRELQPA